MSRSQNLAMPCDVKLLRAGDHVGCYEVVRAVATGGMGAVWLGRLCSMHGFEKLVAIKTIRPELLGLARFRTMLLDEARLCSKLAHPNVAQILDAGEHDGAPYIVFEWVEGNSLEAVCRALAKREGPPPTTFLLRVAEEICAGLHAAHELRDDRGETLGVIHRDVSPRNVLVSGMGFVKIIDFGIAKAKRRLIGETSSGFVKGTPQYMAPEQASGRPVDRRADVWSVGAVLYRCLAGKPPIRSREQLAELLANRRVIEPLPDTVPEEARAIVERAMQRDPSKRYATAGQMRRDLEKAIRSIGQHASISRITASATMRPAMPSLSVTDEHSQAAIETRPDPPVSATLPCRMSDVVVHVDPPRNPESGSVAVPLERAVTVPAWPIAAFRVVRRAPRACEARTSRRRDSSPTLLVAMVAVALAAAIVLIALGCIAGGSGR